VTLERARVNGAASKGDGAHKSKDEKVGEGELD